ncbi:cupin domain-containing protein [Alteromonas sediminis]
MTLYVLLKTLLNPNFNIPSFLKDHWQRSPCVIRNALPDFVDPIDEHELAGLAQEAEIDSRIVAKLENQWHVSHGPFEDFDTVCKGDWTLMVQGVDKWLPEISALASAFSFIPNWRFDDVMISFAVPGAGVGPHVDQYDVFLIQGKGKRHWQVGKPNAQPTLSPHKDLCQVAAFDACIDVELSPGDILYIPPGWPHCGTSIEASLTYSIGFRAPDVQDLMVPLQDTLQSIPSLTRYTDPGLNSRAQSAMVNASEIEILESLMHSIMQTPQWRFQLMCYLSDQHLPTAPLDVPFSVSEITECLNQENTITPIPGCRPLCSEAVAGSIFINGNLYAASDSSTAWLLLLFDTLKVPPLPSSTQDHIEICQLVTTLVNEGLLIVD